MKDIIGYEGLYAVTEAGKVWSYPKPRSSKNGKWLKPRRMTIKRVGNRDYRTATVQLYRRSQAKSFLIHRLVAEAFIPNPHNLSQVNHIDGNPANNHVNNLEWVTGFENMKHAQNTGLTNQFTAKSMANRSKQGKANWRNAAKAHRLFTPNEVAHIIKLHASGKSCRAIARYYGCSNTTISNICNKKAYKHDL